MTLNWLLGWWNVIYLIPFFLALIYLGLYAVTGLTFGDADVDSDVDADADVDHDWDVDQNVPVDHDVDTDTSLSAPTHPTDSGLVASAAQSGAPGFGATSMLYWLGVGKIPVSLILMVLGLTWGASGFALNNVTKTLFSQNWMVAIVSVPGAFVLSTFCTRTLSRWMARYMPTTETSARRKHDLVGTVGQAVLPIDTTFGLVAVRDRHQLHQVSCKLARDGESVPKGASVLLVDFDPAKNLFDVVPYNAD